MTRKQAVKFLLDSPVKYAHMLGFNKLSDLHNDWIIEMIRGQEDYTLEAHRGSYKTTCVSVALATSMILLPNIRTMFMRKTDSDVKEVVKQVQKILCDSHTQYLVQSIYGVPLRLTTASATEISKERAPKGFNAQTQVAREGGSVAKAARKQLESKLGRSVITKDKASDYLLPENDESQQEDK